MDNFIQFLKILSYKVLGYTAEDKSELKVRKHLLDKAPGFILKGKDAKKFFEKMDSAKKNKPTPDELNRVRGDHQKLKNISNF